MAAKTTPNGSNTYQPFVGFTYKDASGNMWHSITDLKIYRTSNGNRYNESITPAMTDKVVDVPGGDGQYYFGTTFKNRTFTVDYAFEELTKTEIDTIKMVFSGDGIHELVFDEDRDTSGKALKIWSAKVTGTATMKHLCFEEDGEDIYKGEGSITFTCYYPYARSENIERITTGETVQKNNGDLPASFTVELSYTCPTTITDQHRNLCGICFRNEEQSKITAKVMFATIKILGKGETVKYKWDSKTGVVMEEVGGKWQIVPITNNGIYKVPPREVIWRSAVPPFAYVNTVDESSGVFTVVKSEFYELYR